MGKRPSSGCTRYRERAQCAGSRLEEGIIFRSGRRMGRGSRSSRIAKAMLPFSGSGPTALEPPSVSPGRTRGLRISHRLGTRRGKNSYLAGPGPARPLVRPCGRSLCVTEKRSRSASGTAARSGHLRLHSRPMGDGSPIRPLKSGRFTVYVQPFPATGAKYQIATGIFPRCLTCRGGQARPSELMSLNSGTRIGPYEIQSALGASGMGEVYAVVRLRRVLYLRAIATRMGRAH
jgi:hypothetical protein